MVAALCLLQVGLVALVAAQAAAAELRGTLLDKLELGDKPFHEYEAIRDDWVEWGCPEFDGDNPAVGVKSGYWPGQTNSMGIPFHCSQFVPSNTKMYGTKKSPIFQVDFCYGVQRMDSFNEDDEKHSTRARCFETNTEWKPIGSGATVRLWETSTFQKSVSKSTSTSITGSGALGIKLGPIPLSPDASVSITSTSTTTVTHTWGKEEGISHEISCQHGQVWQWRVLYMQKGSDRSFEVSTPNFVCVPSSSPDEPQCPAGYCYNLEPFLGCSCCNSDRWAADPADGNKCPT